MTGGQADGRATWREPKTIWGMWKGGVVYHDTAAGLLFICASRRLEPPYEDAESVAWESIGIRLRGQVSDVRG